MAVIVQYNYLDDVTNEGSARMMIKGEADFITARRVSSDVIQILDQLVAPDNRGKGYGKELVEFLLEECIEQKVTRVEIKSNDNPSWWRKAQGFRNGKLIKL
jgi:GNAT superfamily N-acetyltransferase